MKRASQVVLVISVLTMLSTEQSRAADWMLRVQTMSRVCHVQLSTASPIGDDFKGPFSSRKKACEEAANQYDETTSDQSKCWTYGGGTVSGCKSDGITLPPRKQTKKKK
jgi:hypothetical protein